MKERSKMKENKFYCLLISDQNLLISHLVVGQVAFLIFAVT